MFNVLTAGAPGSTRSVRLLCCTQAVKDIIAEDAIPGQAIQLGDDFGEFPLVKTGDGVAGLLKMFNEKHPRSKGTLLK